ATGVLPGANSRSGPFARDGSGRNVFIQRRWRVPWRVAQRGRGRHMRTITVLLVDDHAIVRQGLRALLGTATDIQVIGEAENGRQAVLETKRLQPDVVLLDLAMPLLNGVEAARQIAHEVPSARVL